MVIVVQLVIHIVDIKTDVKEDVGSEYHIEVHRSTQSLILLVRKQISFCCNKQPGQTKHISSDKSNNFQRMCGAHNYFI